MEDQAHGLRQMVLRKAQGRDGATCRLIGVGSGKGGVGKTSVVVNLGLALRRAGHRVAIFDADLGLANVDVLLGLTPRFHLGHVVSGIHPLDAIVARGPEGLDVIPGSSGLQELASLDAGIRERLLDQLAALLNGYDYVLVDTASGISRNVTRFLHASNPVIVVVAPEPTAIVDAYALIKVLSGSSREQEILLLVNSVGGEREASRVFEHLSSVVDRFLKRQVHLLGFVARDEKLSRSVRSQKPLLIAHPGAPASRCFLRLAEALRQRPALGFAALTSGTGVT